MSYQNFVRVVTIVSVTLMVSLVHPGSQIGRTAGETPAVPLTMISRPLASTSHVGPGSSMQSAAYSSDLKELRKSFNRDRGKIRLLILLSPS